MALSFTSTTAGSTADYQKYLYGPIKKTARLNQPTILDFSFASVEDPAFVKLVRGNYVTFTTGTFSKWFTGYIQNTPTPEYIGVNSAGQPRWLYKYQAASDDIILGLYPLGIIPQYINTTQGAILQDLVNRLYPGKFDVTGILPGRPVIEYAVDPQKKFTDIVREFCDSSHFRWYANDLKLYFEQQDTTPAAITIDGNSKTFTPSNLTIQPTVDVVNDSIVLGQIEPQDYVTEYMVSDGLTAQYPTMSEVYGVNAEVKLDETFTGGSIDLSKWAVVDPTGVFLLISNGYLNCLGGNNAGAWDIYLRTLNPILLEGNLRLTHGEWDFVQASDGMIGSLWTSNTPSAALTGCVYGLKCSKSGSSTVINPVVLGAVDSTQGFTIGDYSKRYIMRTVINFDQLPRTTSPFSYVDNTGAVGFYGGSSVAANATISTFVSVIDPTTGNKVGQYVLNSTASLSNAELAAYYAPMISNDLNATVTNITISAPLQAGLALKTLPSDDFKMFSSAPGNLSSTSDQMTFAYQATGSQPYFWSFLEPPTANSSALAGVVWRESLVANAAFIGIFIQNDGTLVWRYRSTTGGAITTTSSGITRTAGCYLMVDSMVGRGQPPYVAYSDDAKTWSIVGTAPTTFAAVLAYAGIMGMAGVTGQTSYVKIKNVYFTDWTNQTLTAIDIGSPTSPGSLVGSSASFATQIIGPNEIDAQDGEAPIATITSNGSNRLPQAAYGSTFYSPTATILQFFSDSASKSVTTPPEKTLMRLTYRKAGPSAGRVQNGASIATEATNWGDSGLRSQIRSDLKPLPHTSQECELAAGAIIQEFSYPHYSGTYTQPSLFDFTGQPLPGTILTFQNMDATSFPGISSEVIQQVETVFNSARANDGSGPKELYTHTITFGPADVLQRFLSSVDDPQYGAVVPAANTQLPTFIDYTNLTTTYGPDVTSVQLVSWNSSGWNWSLGVNPPSGGGFEVRSTDSGWGSTAGKNLIARLTGTQQTFSSSRTLAGKTVYVKAYDSSGHYSRFPAVGRADLPNIPPPIAAASADFTNGLDPIVSYTLPTVLEDVWGVEIRGADNITVLVRDDLANVTQLGSASDSFNVLEQPDYYVYTYNLLGEYSAAYHLNQFNPFLSKGPEFANFVANGTFEKTTWGDKHTGPILNVIRNAGEVLVNEWFVVLNDVQ